MPVSPRLRPNGRLLNGKKPPPPKVFNHEKMLPAGTAVGKVVQNMDNPHEQWSPAKRVPPGGHASFNLFSAWGT